MLQSTGVAFWNAYQTLLEGSKSSGVAVATNLRGRLSAMFLLKYDMFSSSSAA